MKATAFKNITPKRRYQEYRLSGHALDRIKQRFSQESIKFLRDNISLMIFNGKQISNFSGKVAYRYGNFKIVVKEELRLVVTIYDVTVYN